MAADGFGDRVAFGPRQGGLTYAELGRPRRRRRPRLVRRRGVERVGLVDVNSEAVPILVFGSALAGVPFVPLNYRLADDQLRAVIGRTAPSVAGRRRHRRPRGSVPFRRVELVTAARVPRRDARRSPPTALRCRPPIQTTTALLLFTSGTTGEPKAAVLRHRHLASYVISTVEFMCADEDEAALVSVPPYHVAGVSAVLSSVYAGRRIVYLPAFTPEAWVTAARDEAGHPGDGRADDARPHPRRARAAGRAPAGPPPPGVRRRAHAGPGDRAGAGAAAARRVRQRLRAHRDELDDRRARARRPPGGHRQPTTPAVRRRLGSVGKPLPSLEVEIRDDDGEALGASESGEIFVRGEQVAGEYLGRAGAMPPTGGSPRVTPASGTTTATSTSCGRLDDVIVRGGENISPGEIEDVLVAHPPSPRRPSSASPTSSGARRSSPSVVLHEGATADEAELQEWVRSHLRSSKTPQRIEFRDQLPYNDTGKLLRRVLKAELVAAPVS